MYFHSSISAANSSSHPGSAPVKIRTHPLYRCLMYILRHPRSAFEANQPNGHVVLVYQNVIWRESPWVKQMRYGFRRMRIASARISGSALRGRVQKYWAWNSAGEAKGPTKLLWSIR